VGDIEKICGKLLVTFCTIFQILLINLFLYSKKLYFLYTTNLITSHKIQSLIFALGGYLKNKKVKLDRQTSGGHWRNMWKVACNFLYNFSNFTNQYFFVYSIGCIMYHKFNYKSQKSILNFCTRWLP